MTNYGPLVLEDYKIYLEFEDVLSLESVDKRDDFFDTFKYKYNIKFKSNFVVEFIPEHPILVQEDSIEIDSLCFRTNHLPTSPKVKWTVLARDFKYTNQFVISVEPKMEKRVITKYVDNPNEFVSMKKIRCKYN